MFNFVSFRAFQLSVLLFLLNTSSLAANGLESSLPAATLWVDFDVADFDSGHYTKWHSTEFSLLKLVLTEVRKRSAIKLEKANTGRALSLIEKSGRGCIANLRYTQARAEQLYFSEPFSLYFGLKLYYRSDNSKAVAAVSRFGKKRVDLQALLSQGATGRLGIVAGRGYGAQIDDVLRNPEMRYNLYVRGANDMSNGLLEMLFQGRIDYVLEYPEVVAHYADMNLGELSSAELRGEQAMVAGHIACGKSAEGQRLVNEFNRAITELRGTPEYLQAHLAGLPETLQKPFVAQFNKVFLGEKKHGQ